MSITRDEIRQLCIAHDKFMAEAREEIRSPPVSEIDNPGILYREYDNSEPAPAAADDAGDSDGDWQEAVAEGIAEAGDYLRKEMHQEFAGELLKRDREIAALRNELCEVTGFVSGVLAALGKPSPPTDSKAADVVDLPHTRNFLRRVQNG